MCVRMLNIELARLGNHLLDELSAVALYYFLFEVLVRKCQKKKGQHRKTDCPVVLYSWENVTLFLEWCIAGDSRCLFNSGF